MKSEGSNVDKQRKIKQANYIEQLKIRERQIQTWNCIFVYLFAEEKQLIYKFEYIYICRAGLSFWILFYLMIYNVSSLETFWSSNYSSD